MNAEPLILAIETALDPGSIAIFRGEKALGIIRGVAGVSRSADLLEMIADLLKKHKLDKNEIDLITVSTGPGSFTGIRVGVATARALGMGWNIQVIGVPLLEAMTIETSGNQQIVSAAQNAQEIIWQYFDRDDNKLTVVSKNESGTTEDFINSVRENGAGKFLNIIGNSQIIRVLDLQFDSAKENIKKFTVASDNEVILLARFSTKIYLDGLLHKYPSTPEYLRGAIRDRI
jgi:tRNA threonylcarbamoyl adenosine modification protein YeaZ